ncbi:MAG: TRAP transporter substrate-binding protein DctP, partial [Myxococcota bacterium]|nr:TRAP transporter substrate-binding protein DctP [Myxococcota bacterium]
MFRYLFCLFFLLLPQVCFADVRLAVLEFRGMGVSDGLLQLLTDEIRTGVLHVSKGQKIKGEKLIIMTRENMMQVLKDQGLSAEDCTGACEVEIAKNIGADYVISGNVTKIDTLFALVVKLHSTADSNLLASESLKTESKKELINGTEKIGAKVFQEGLNLSSAKGSTNRSSGFQSGFAEEEESDWVMEEGAQKSVVHFTSTPSGATVLMNGNLVCPSTPCKKSVVLGKHNINIQKERYFPWKERVSLSKGKKVEAVLKPTFGFLEIRAPMAGASLLINDKPLGEIPIAKRELDPGQYTIRVQDACYKGPDYSFELKAGATESVNYPIKSRQAGIDVSVVEANGDDVIAAVYVDGEEVGESPGRFKVPVCAKELLVVGNGQRAKRRLSLREKEVQTIEVEILGSKKSTVQPKNGVYALNLGTVAPEGTPWFEHLKRLEKRIETESLGKINVTIYGGGLLGSEIEMIEDIASGARLQGGSFSTGALAGALDVASLSMLELPYLFQNNQEVDAVLDSVLYDATKEALAPKGVALYAWSENGWRSFGTKGGPATSPEQLSRYKMRSQESKVHLDMYKAMGVQAASKPVSEVLPSLNAGIVSGFDNTPLFSIAAGWVSAISHFTMSEHIYQPAAVVYSQSFIDSLPADLKRIV